jgi:hypothetical protein
MIKSETKEKAIQIQPIKFAPFFNYFSDEKIAYIAMKLRFIKIFKKINIMHLCDERTFIFRQYSGSGSEGWEAKGES